VLHCPAVVGLLGMLLLSLVKLDWLGGKQARLGVSALVVNVDVRLPVHQLGHLIWASHFFIGDWVFLTFIHWREFGWQIQKLVHWKLHSVLLVLFLHMGRFNPEDSRMLR